MQILFFAALAGFVLFKLYSVLGKNVGAPPPKPTPAQPSGRNGAKPVSPTPLRPAFTGPAAAGLEAIYAADNQFDPEQFLSGARIAYEQVVEAYSAGDKKTLKRLLQNDVYARYAEAIDARQKNNIQLDTEVIRIKKAEIVEAELDKKQARLVVAFSADISSREQTEGKPDETKVQTSLTTEEWTFVREVRARDPNWKLASVATLA
jgi:predicted lipid-binding transport protein (Tim44 family)